MHPKFKDLDNDSLLFLLEDCLLRAKDGAEGGNLPYVQGQIRRAKEIQEELSFRLKEVSVIQ